VTKHLPGAAVVAAVAFIAACSRPSTAPSPEPSIQREMRGLWVATVRNIDWPSRDTGLTADQQRAELLDILDRAVRAGFNTIVFQVRPAADALYASPHEPWGMWLTGKQGVDPGYDPLAFAVEESHKRGLEVHAWINPFRAGWTRDTALFAPSHVWNARRELTRVYGSLIWMDPGDPAVQEHSARVIADIVQRYDIDGIHADDYFYPYPERDSAAGRNIEFPDSATYARSGTTLSRDDWRRNNIDRFVERMYRESHALKPAIKVGLSPFGIWRPGNPPSVRGFDAYAAIYADSKKWLQEGWIDYLVPQLYWAISAPQQSFPELLDWWVSVDTLKRHLWPGLATYRVNSGAANQFPRTTEIADQITIDRARPDFARGTIMFNTTTTLKRDNGVLATIVPLFRERALVPAFPWLDASVPPSSALSVTGRTLRLIPNGAAPRWWFVRLKNKGGLFTRSRWTSLTLFGSTTSIDLDADPAEILVNAVSATGVVGPTVTYRRP
jgi:uncharacterized lipoprotein YddW (UPF0748 family)